MAAAPPRLEGVLETALYVDDLERSLRFYQKLFGFASVYSGDRLEALQIAERQILLLFKKRASLSLPRTSHDGEGQLHLAFAITVAELSAWEAWLAQHGIALEEKKHWERGGVSLYFRDPDGHLLELATPGVWRIY
jgi:catechol 2,3-dioxygenase-like lactoylglutathione lyase family enzyme